MMFNRSRRKIIWSIMGSLILLFVITLSVILTASFREIRQQNLDMLQRYVELYPVEQAQEGPFDQGSGPKENPEQGPKEKSGDRFMKEKPPIDDRPDYRLSTFYSVVLSDDGTVLAVDNADKGVYEEEDLIRIAQDILANSRTSGRIGNLTYMVKGVNDGTLVAFMDNTVSEGGLNTLLHNVLAVGCIAIVVLFFLSLFLSKRIIRPLEENDQRQKQFISDASHELKTPVSVISANAELLSRELGGNEWLENIQYENERMGELVKQLLDLSRAENAEVPMEPVDLSRVATGEILVFESLAFDRGKTLQSEVEEGILLTGSQTQLAQLVSILLDNAVRHTTGSEIEVSLKRQAHTAVFCVTNEGTEIPPEQQEHLFDRFYRIDEARNSEGQHYGLGLSIAKAVAEKHGGNIGVSCRDGKVRFTVSLPIKK